MTVTCSLGKNIATKPQSNILLRVKYRLKTLVRFCCEYDCYGRVFSPNEAVPEFY